jgi:hypothetical protein
MCPTYEGECQKCGRVQDYFRTIPERHDTPRCCGKPTKLIISAVKGFADFPEYVSPASGKLIRGRRERADDFKRTNSRPYEGFEQEKKEANKRVAEQEKRDDAALEHAARTAWHQIPPSRRKHLE